MYLKRILLQEELTNWAGLLSWVDGWMLWNNIHANASLLSMHEILTANKYYVSHTFIWSLPKMS